MSLYERRLEEEWKLLASLERLNPEVVKLDGRGAEATGAVFSLILRQSPALVEVGASLEVVESHEVRFRFPAFYPAVHLEAFLNRPVFHPNVHPLNGFVCLWNDSSSPATVLDAVDQLRRVISYRLVNKSPNHVMQPRALDWLESPSRPLPFPTEGLERPREFERERMHRERPAHARRRRLV